MARPRLDQPYDHDVEEIGGLGIPILSGSLSPIFLGIWTDQYGGRIVFVTVMVAASIATLLSTWTDTTSPR